MITFNYKKEKSGILRPVANLILQNRNWATGLSMYIDSGADISAIPLNTGKLLGLDKTNANIKKMRGLGGPDVEYIEKTITFVFNEKEEIDAPVAWVLIEGTPALLGRKGIFNKFKIIFDEKEEKIKFHRN